MFRSLWLSFLLLIGGGWIAEQTSADFTISVSPQDVSTAVPGSDIELSFIVSLSSSEVAELSGYTISLGLENTNPAGDLGGLFLGGLEQITDFGDLLFTDTQESPTSASGTDGSFVGTSPVDTDPIPLFSLIVDVTPNASPGDYLVTFDALDDLFSLLDADLNDIPLDQIDFEPARLTVTAVPEPCSLVAITGLAVAGVWRRPTNRSRSRG